MSNTVNITMQADLEFLVNQSRDYAYIEPEDEVLFDDEAAAMTKLW